LLNTDPKRPLARIVAALAGLSIFGWGLGAILWHGDLHYGNFFGELVFAPFAIRSGSSFWVVLYSSLKSWAKIPSD
jgi:hypothetical protein